MVFRAFSTPTQKLGLIVILSFVIVFFFYSSSWSIPQPSTGWIPSSIKSHWSGKPIDGEIAFPADYNPPIHDDWCEDHYGLSYLKSFRDEHRSFCDPDVSMSGVECFTSRVNKEHPQSFCVMKSVLFQPQKDDNRNSMKLHCKVKDHAGNWTGPEDQKPPSFWDLPKHIFDTGPGHIIDKWIDVRNETNRMDAATEAAMRKCAAESANAPDYKVMVLRDAGKGKHHWHTMWEIVAYQWTIDSLRITPQTSPFFPRPNRTQGFFTEASVPNSQAIVLDNDPNGFFFDLWTQFAEAPVVRMKDLKEPQCFHNVLIPIPGGANPLWAGDHDSRNCRASPNIDVFARRALDRYGHIKDRRKGDAPVTVTIIERHTTRQIKDFDLLVDALKNKYPDAKIQTYDFGANTFANQLQTAKETDVLVGVHGAGLAMQLFMNQNSAVVEVLPAKFMFKGYRNLARLVDHRYFSTHCEYAPYADENMGWQITKEVEMDTGKFLHSVGAAIESMYHSRQMYKDVA